MNRRETFSTRTFRTPSGRRSLILHRVVWRISRGRHARTHARTHASLLRRVYGRHEHRMGSQEPQLRGERASTRVKKLRCLLLSCRFIVAFPSVPLFFDFAASCCLSFSLYWCLPTRCPHISRFWPDDLARARPSCALQRTLPETPVRLISFSNLSVRGIVIS